jgi:DNA-binding LacI/PurR family transcriptional regulator
MAKPGKSKKPTIATVAERAGVAVSTVSRFLNGHYVSAAVRERLSAVIADLGYSRSWTARNLSLGLRGSVGVVVDSSDDPWFVQLLLGIEEELISRDCSLMLSSLELLGRYDAARVLDWIQGHRVDGIILAKSQRRDRPILRAAIDAHLPIVAVVPDETATEIPVLQCNNLEAGTIVADHLAGLGHTRIAFAGGPPHSIDSKHRLRGLREGLSRRGIRLDAAQVFSCGGWELSAGAAFAEALFAKPLQVTAIVCANDALALGALRVAHERGIRVPQDVSVVGFDGLPYGALSWPALTTVAQPMREMGRVACRRLFEALADPGRIERIQFRMHLVARESSGPAPGSAGARHLHAPADDAAAPEPAAPPRRGSRSPAELD